VRTTRPMLNRRRFLRRVAAAGPGALLLSRAGIASENKTPLDPASPQAKALGYRRDGSQTDRPAPNQACASCMHFTRTADPDQGECAIFSDHLVSANGWCRAYAKGY